MLSFLIAGLFHPTVISHNAFDCTIDLGQVLGPQTSSEEKYDGIISKFDHVDYNYVRIKCQCEWSRLELVAEERDISPVRLIAARGR